jgi:16S rRNA (cytosine967-C5)-methyltransferase
MKPISKPSRDIGALPRAIAARAVAAVYFDHQSLTTALTDAQTRVVERDKGLVSELCHGVLRYGFRLQAIARQLLRHPFKTKDHDLAALVLVGLYQVHIMQLPAHAAVAATVAATRVLGKPWASGLINALLRRFQRDSATILAEIEQHDPDLQWLLPTWLLQALRVAWPEQWPIIAEASYHHPPQFLRVNRLKMTRDRYLQALDAAGIQGLPLSAQPDGIRVPTPIAMHQLPGYTQGWVSIQDATAQRAAELLNAQPGDWVLDACAAPGGKTTHLQERANNQLHLVAVEYDLQRLKTLRDNCKRLGVSANCYDGDVTTNGPWMNHRYDRILIDAPCSATGVIRRHPDIRYLRREQDLASFMHIQHQLLVTLWPLLNPGGTVLYSTCSLLPQENSHRIKDFLAMQSDARLVVCPDQEDAIQTHWGQQWLPKMQGGDGFFFALLTKQAT